MLQPNIAIFRHGGSPCDFDNLLSLAEDASMLDEYRQYDAVTPASHAAAKKGDFAAYLQAKGMENLKDKFQRKFMNLQMKSVAKQRAPKDNTPVAAPSRSSDAGRLTGGGGKAKAKSKTGRGRGFGYMSLSKALRQLAGGPKSTKARLERAVGSKLYKGIMDAIAAAKPVRMGKRGKALKRRGALTAKSAEQIGGKFYGKMSKAYPFSDKSAKAPKDRDERVMNKARFIRGLALAYQLLASNVGKTEKAAARAWLTSKKKKLRMFEWDILRDLEYLGEEVYAAFMGLVEMSETELDECIENFDSLEEEDTLVDDLDALCEMFDEALDEGKQSQEARELELYIDNNNTSPYKQKWAIFKNLAKKRRKGKYNRALAIKGMMHAVDNGAREYTKKHGSPGDKPSHLFPRSARTEVATSFVDAFEEEFQNGGLDEGKSTMRLAALERDIGECVEFLEEQGMDEYDIYAVIHEGKIKDGFKMVFGKIVKVAEKAGRKYIAGKIKKHRRGEKTGVGKELHKGAKKAAKNRAKKRESDNLQAVASDPAFVGEDALDEELRLRSGDKRVLKAFTMGQAARSNKLNTDGMTLNGNWMGGLKIATLDKNGGVSLVPTGSRAGDTVHRALRKLVGGGMIEWDDEDEDEDLEEMLDPNWEAGKDKGGKRFKLRKVLPNGAIVSTVNAFGSYETLVFLKGEMMLEIGGNKYRNKSQAIKGHQELVKQWKSKSKAKVRAAFDEMWPSLEESCDLAPGYMLGEGLMADNLDAVDMALTRHSQIQVLEEAADYHKLGAQLQHWNQGEGSPVHKVGSMLFAGRKPWRKDVCDAVSELQAMMMSPNYGEHESELRSIISKLRSVCLG